MMRKYRDSKVVGWQEPKIMSNVVVRGKTYSKNKEMEEGMSDEFTDKPHQITTPDLFTPVPIPFTNEAVDKFMHMNVKSNAYELKMLRQQAMKAQEIKLVRYVTDAESRARKSDLNPMSSKGFILDPSGVHSPVDKHKYKEKMSKTHFRA